MTKATRIAIDKAYKELAAMHRGDFVRLVLEYGATDALLRDITIPAGSMLIEPSQDRHIADTSEAITIVVGLTPDTYGELTYYFDSDIDEEQLKVLESYFPPEVLYRGQGKENE